MGKYFKKFIYDIKSVKKIGHESQDSSDMKAL